MNILIQANGNYFFWGGIVLIGMAILVGMISGIILFFQGKFLKKELMEDYGELGKNPDRGK